jgi:hypothetical protein
MFVQRIYKKLSMEDHTTISKAQDTKEAKQAVIQNKA